MGVDISLHMEVRRRGEWHLMTFQSPFWETNNEYPIFDTEVYNCRYYHFREFLNEAPTQRWGNKDILSEELRAKMSSDDFDNEFGTFMFDDLEKHCDHLEKLLISGISHAGIYSIKEQLDRIEKKLNGDASSVETEEDDEERLNRYEEVTSIEQMYKDFMWDYGCLFWFRDRVRALASIGDSTIPDSDIRIFYLLC